MFLPTEETRVRAVGNPESKIAFVSDFVSGYDLRTLTPMNGPDGGVFERCLHNANLIRGEVYVTSLFKSRGLENSYSNGKFEGEAQNAVRELESELSALSANIIVALGEASFAALSGTHFLSRYRGYVFPTKNLYPPRKVIGTFHPRDSLRGMYKYRYLIVNDFKKALAESKTPELKRPLRQLVYRFDGVEDALEWLAYFESADTVCFDIEVLNYEVACISFSSDPSIAVVIPFVRTWTEEEELRLWEGVQRVLGNPNSTKVVQNGIFDIQFLLAKNGIVVRGPVMDTMIAHSIMYPDLPKNLGFLGSIYCGSQEYWKDRVKFSNIKEES